MIVALYVAVWSQRVKLRGWWGRRSIVYEGSRDKLDVIAVSATNISPRPTTVTNVVFSYGVWRWKRYYFVKFMRGGPSDLPALLTDGQPATWYIPMGKENQWARELVNELKLTRFDVATLKVNIQTSNGGTTVIRPDKDFRDTLMALVEEKKTAKALAE